VDRKKTFCGAVPEREAREVFLYRLRARVEQQVFSPRAFCTDEAQVVHEFFEFVINAFLGEDPKYQYFLDTTEEGIADFLHGLGLHDFKVEVEKLSGDAVLATATGGEIDATLVGTKKFIICELGRSCLLRRLSLSLWELSLNH